MPSCHLHILLLTVMCRVPAAVCVVACAVFAAGWLAFRMLAARSTAKADVGLLLDRLMGQLVAHGSSSGGSGGSKSYKPQIGCDVTLQELLGAFEVRLLCSVFAVSLDGGSVCRTCTARSCASSVSLLLKQPGWPIGTPALRGSRVVATAPAC